MKYKSRAGEKRSVRPLLLLEINEVPWRLLDKAVERWPNLRHFLESAASYTTLSSDIGELSPWITWPSLHRGIPNTEHGIQHLGQDVNTFRGTPIWQEYRNAGLTIGICGSMQSWPPIDPGPGGFFIPDTFAHNERCIPSFVEPLQRFGMSQVQTNRHVVHYSALFSRHTLQFMPALFRVGIRPLHYKRIAQQLAGEFFDRTKLARRPTFQTILFWEVFRRLYNAKKPPSFATFFTNHVANLMHRYWHDLFPEDFERSSSAVRPHAETMDFALGVLDEMIADAFVLQKQIPGLLLCFASSMGQAAVYRKHEGFSASVVNLDALAAAFELPKGSYQTLLSMVPQAAFEIADPAVRAGFKSRLEKAQTLSKKPLFSVQESGSSVSVTILTPSRQDVLAGALLRCDQEAPVWIDWSKAGVRMHEVEASTGYHIPEGVLAVVGEGIQPDQRRLPVAATEVKSMLLRLAGFEFNSLREQVESS